MLHTKCASYCDGVIEFSRSGVKVQKMQCVYDLGRDGVCVADL